MLCRKGDIDKPLVVVNWPAGHFIFVRSLHHTPTKAVLMRYGLRVAAPGPRMEAMAAACSITCTAVTPTNDWITDRPPTAADVDSDGDVVARYHPDDDDYCYMHWSYVGAGVPWRHCVGAGVPPTDLEPAPTPRKFASLTRTVTDHGHIIDAIDDDGVAWWMMLSTDDPESEWQQLTPLPGREVVG